jgi:DNA end-binding protein Ku
MAARAYWKGYLRLSLVTAPVRLYSAVTESGRIAFHKIHKPTGERIHHENVVEGVGEVDKGDIAKGFEYEKGRYVIVEDEELERLRLESAKVIDLVQFSDRDELDPLYFDKGYFVAPDGKVGDEAYRVIREALRRSGKVALGQIVLSRRERIAALRPCGRGLVLDTLRYEYEVREGKDYFEDVEDKGVEQEQLELATQIMDRKTKPFDPERFHDHYQEALRELVQAKLKGKLPEAVAAPKPTNVVSLMDALRRSLGEKAEPRSKKPAKKKAAPKRKAAKKPRKRAA